VSDDAVGAVGTEGEGPWPCYRHPKRETMVRCSVCDRPICSDCMVHSPVGVKCPEDARLPKSARVSLKTGRALKAVAASLGSGTAVGFGYYFLLRGVGFFFLAFFLAAGIGYVVGEATFRAGGSYRGRPTAMIAVAGTVWAFLFPLLVLSFTAMGVSLQGVVFALSGQSVINWLMMIVAGFFAWRRNR